MPLLPAAYLEIMERDSSGLKGAKNPKDPRPNAKVGGIGAESSKYCAAFSTVPSSASGREARLTIRQMRCVRAIRKPNISLNRAMPTIVHFESFKFCTTFTRLPSCQPEHTCYSVSAQVKIPSSFSLNCQSIVASLYATLHLISAKFKVAMASPVYSPLTKFDI